MSVYCLLLLMSVSRSSKNFFATQLFAIIVGYIGAGFIAKSDYHFLAKHWRVIAVICIGLLIYTTIFGIAETGSQGVNAKAWIKLPGKLTFQPSELVKIGFMITFAKHLCYLKDNDLITSFKSIMFLCGHAFIPILIVHFQGDDGAAIIFFSMFLTMALAAGVPLRYFGSLILMAAIAIPIAWNYVLRVYQKNRIIGLFDPSKADPDIMFQQAQGKISIGSGGLFGRGLFHGPRVGSVPPAVPVQESDFIFAVAGEELGFIGCMIIIFLIIALLFRSLNIAHKSCDNLGSYICFGFIGMIFSQSLFNLGMCLSILPVMGVTLPFFSAGGSSAACLYLGIGLLQSVYKHKDDVDIMAIHA